MGVVGSTFYALYKMLDVKRKSLTVLTDFHVWTGALAVLSTLYAIGLERCFRVEPSVQWALLSSILYTANSLSWFPLLRIFKGNQEQKMAFNLAYSFVVSFQGIQMIAVCLILYPMHFWLSSTDVFDSLPCSLADKCRS